MAEFDLASLGTVRADDGVPMEVIHLRSRQPVLNEDGTKVTITLLGRSSEVFRECVRAQQLRRAEFAARRVALTDDDLFGEDTQTLTACTVAWTLQVLDGRPFLWSAQNARKLWEDPRFRWLREAALNFMLNDGNFLAPPAAGSMNSSDTPGSNSDLANHSQQAE